MRFLVKSISFILLSLVICEDTHPNRTFNRCGLFNENEIYRERPESETFTISPSGYFNINYDLTGENAPNLTDNNNNDIPDYIEQVGIAADSVKFVLIDQMGFLEPILTADGNYDIYIEDLGPYFYGLSMAIFLVGGGSYIVIDNEFEEGEYFTTGNEAMQVTIAHEFFHAIQRNYATLILGHDKYFWELSSMWIEDVIYPDVNDYIYWMDYFLDNPEQDISDYTTNDPENDAGYSLALFGHYLTMVYDQVEDQKNSVIMRKVWETFTGMYEGEAHLSINEVLNENYYSNFVNAWVDFNARNIYNGFYNDMDNNNSKIYII